MANPPTSFSSKLLRTDLANQVAELVIIKNDLEAALTNVKLMRDRYPPKDEMANEDRAIQMALYRDTIMLITGCFRKDGLTPEETFSTIENTDEFMQWMWDTRDTYIAHTFGPQRQAVSVAIVHPETGKVLGAGPFNFNMVGIAEDHIQGLGQGVTLALNYTNSQLDILSKDLLDEAQKLTPEEALALPNASIHVPGAEDLRTHRRTYRDINAGDKPKRSRRRPRGR